MNTSMSCPGSKIAGLLVLVGALNWGVIGVIGKNPIHKLLAGFPTAERIVYVLVGIAGVLLILKCCKACCGGSCEKKP